MKYQAQTVITILISSNESISFHQKVFDSARTNSELLESRE